MHLWIDSCNFELVKEANEMGLIYGITTNPKILKHSHLPPQSTIETLLTLQEGFVTWQLTENDQESMLKQAKHIFSISPRIIIKVPITKVGLKVIHHLKSLNIQTMATTIFDPIQAIASFKAGAHWAAFYTDRMLHVNLNPYESMKTAVKFGKVLGASIKTSEQFLKCVEIDIDSITVGDALFENLMKDNIFSMKSIDEFMGL
jgi:TalC/MipB family fructose-6-phosphate aldolase